MLNLSLGIAANDEERDAGEGGGEEYEGEEEFRTQTEIGWAMRQKIRGKAAGQEPVTELDKCHKANRLRNRVVSRNGTEVPFAQYGE